MRTTVDIDPELLAEAMELTGLKTKKATIAEALRELIRFQPPSSTCDKPTEVPEAGRSADRS